VGAVHVADYVAHKDIQPKTGPGVRGIVLTSGQIYDGEGPNVTPAYYGEDKSKYADMASLPGLTRANVKILLNAAELDPETFGAQTLKLRDALCKAGRCPTFIDLKGHSHISETYAIGTDDKSLSDPVLKFVKGR
jgi:triacylglycerol lipase